MRRSAFLAILLLWANNRSHNLSCATIPSAQAEAQVTSHAQQLIDRGHLDEAQRLIADGLTRYPHSGALHNLAGIAAAERKDNRAAEHAFLTALKISPSSTPAMLNLARVYYSENKQDSAAAMYRRALQLDNSLEEAHGNLAALLLERRDYRGTLKHLSLLPLPLQTQNRALSMKAAALAATGDRDLAASVIKQMNAHVSEQDVSSAIHVLGQINDDNLLISIASLVPSDQTSAGFRELLAAAYARNGDPVRARSLYETVARDDPSSTKPLTDAARVAYGQHDFEGAAGYLIHALRSKPDDGDAQFFFGIVCINLNLPSDAIHALREAVRLQSGNAAANYALGAALLTGGNKDEAVTYFRKYLQLKPADTHGKFAVGAAEFEAGDLEHARTDLLLLVSDPAVSAGALYLLGKICRLEDNLGEAEDYLKRAAEASPSDAGIYANLGAVYVEKGDLLRARRALDRALELDSDHYLANENLLKVLQKQKDPAAKAQAERFTALTEKKGDEQQLLLRHIDAW